MENKFLSLGHYFDVLGSLSASFEASRYYPLFKKDKPSQARLWCIGMEVATKRHTLAMILLDEVVKKYD